MADVIIVKGGGSSGNRVRRSNASSYGGGFFGLSPDETLIAGALVVGGLAAGYFATQMVSTGTVSLDWSDYFTPPYSVAPPVQVPPTIVQSGYVEMAPEPEQIEELDASQAVVEGEDEFGAGSVIVDEGIAELAPDAVSYGVQRYETMRDNNGELIGITPA